MYKHNREKKNCMLQHAYSVVKLRGLAPHDGHHSFYIMPRPSDCSHRGLWFDKVDKK